MHLRRARQRHSRRSFKDKLAKARSGKRSRSPKIRARAAWRGSCTGRYRVAQAEDVIYNVWKGYSGPEEKNWSKVLIAQSKGGPTAEATLKMYGVESWIDGLEVEEKWPSKFVAAVNLVH